MAPIRFGASHIVCQIAAMNKFYSLITVAFACILIGQHRLEGTVRDQTGTPIAGAEVTLEAGPASLTQTTNSQGRFYFQQIAASSGRLLVRAKGFAELEREWSAQKEAKLEIVLAPAPISEQITVTAERTETRVSDTAASITLLSSEALSHTPALAIDDILRQVTGFSLFRRSSSRFANPTSQGVSLRGVGASGASRALVLADAIPINDPFGGWVYWDLIPRLEVERIEVVRGGTSSLYGSGAMGGVINLIPRSIADRALLLEASYGNRQTPDLSFFAGGRTGQWLAQLGAARFQTDGYIIVDESQRGRVDTPAASRYSTFDLLLGRVFSDRAKVFARGTVFGESRKNGTPLQRNRTHLRQLAIGSDGQSKTSQFSIRAYGSTQVFDQDFSAIAADRNSESLTRSQRVPAQQVGVSSQWSGKLGSKQTLVAGFDAREVRGASDELIFAANRLTSAVGAGGRERWMGFFGEDRFIVNPRWIIVAGARFDRWLIYKALSTTRSFSPATPPAAVSFADRTESALSPRVSALGRLAENVSVMAAAYQAFRAPTLNELYRSFRVGNVVTLANDKLRAERLTGGEAGASFTALNKKLNARGTFFWSEITRPVANVTLSTTPTLITRQRQNLGRTRARGVELEAEARISNWAMSGGYQLVYATVLSFPANLTLEGLRIPQVPRHQLTFQVSYSNPSRLTASVQGRIIGAQFDDDQNQFKLDRYFTLDALILRRIACGVELLAAAENLLNQRYAVGRTPIKTIGPPLLARFGVRLRLGSR
jgi:outer membrane receptor protein involved in Fe transport